MAAAVRRPNFNVTLEFDDDHGLTEGTFFIVESEPFRNNCI